MNLDKKALELFLEKYNTSTEKYLLNNIEFEDLPLTCQNALIIDWLDSIGYYIQNWGVSVVDLNIGFYSDILYKNELIEHSEDLFKTRQEAISKAIEKCNEIINS